MSADVIKIEKVLKSTLRLGTPRESGSGGFILSDGSVIPSTDHQASCKRAKLSLKKVLRAGVCRYMFYTGPQGNIAAFEFTGHLTNKQKNAIHRTLRANDYYTVVTTKTVINRFRPVRTLPF